MRKGKSVIGKDVLSLEDGLKLHSVKDILLAPSNDAVLGLLIDEGGLFAGSKVIPAEEIVSFGRDAVVVRGRESVLEASAVPEVRAIVDQPGKLIGTRVFTDTGDEQGTVTDVYFDEQTRRVAGVEVGRGAVADVAQGTRFLPLDEVVRVGVDVLYVRPETVATLDQQRGGVQGAMSDAGEKIKAAGSDIGKKTKEAAASAKDGASSGASGSTAAAGDRAEQALVGRRTSRDVDDDSGSVLIPAGRTLTEEDVRTARERGKLRDLFTSVGLAEADMAAAGIKDALGTAGDNAASLWDRFVAKIGDAKDATGQRIDEDARKRRLETIEDAVGRPVTKVILDLDDRVILDLGDIITHAAIQRANDAGALDALLAAVYKGEVQFGKEEMRADRPAVAAIGEAEGKGAGVPVMESLRSEVQTAEERRRAEAAQKREQAEAERIEREQEREERAATRQQSKRERESVGAT